MAKKNVIKLEMDSPATVLGVASNDKIWKVCWKINQGLGLDLSTQEEPAAMLAGPTVYTDFESDSDFDYQFFEADTGSRKVSRLARQFRFWMVIKPKRDLAPDVAALLKQLAGIDSVSLAHDLTEEKDIKKLIP